MEGGYKGATRKCALWLRERLKHQDRIALVGLRQAELEDPRLGRRVDRLLLLRRDRRGQRHLRIQRQAERMLQLLREVVLLQVDRERRLRTRRGRHEGDDVLDAADVFEGVEGELEDLPADERPARDRRRAGRDRARCGVDLPGAAGGPGKVSISLWPTSMLVTSAAISPPSSNRSSASRARRSRADG